MNVSEFRALVVEDSPTFCSIIKLVLDSLGIKERVFVADGRKAIETLETFSADIIFMDWMMEGMDGIECTRRIRSGASASMPDVAIIMVSAKDTEEDLRCATEVGVDIFVPKPITIKTVHEAAVRALDKSRHSRDRDVEGSS